ncbi:MAG: helix-turn-helix domain-containing protein [Phycisphaerales bacterium]|jgi:hypothetical protein|nr:helix-turn-helix domain-containing protein [Phycisphaerales bacterium]
MARKMYYSEQEAADLLGVSVVQLDQYVQEQKLHVFKDGNKNMYKGDEVETLADDALGNADPMAQTVIDDVEEIELTPAEGSLGDADPMARTVMDTPDAVTLSDADDLGPTGGKEDTVITAEGISIFDEEDLEIETADPMAKTQIAPSLEDQIALDGVGSGSGLLDLTQESDDTSLGAELLDHIDIEEPDEPVEFDAVSQGAVAVQPVATEYVVDSDNVSEAPDPLSGLFTGILVGCAAVAMLMGAITIAAIMDVAPEYIQTMNNKLTMVMAAGAGFAVVAGAVGLMLGKASASRRI